MSTAPPDGVQPVSLTPTLIVEDDPAMQARLREVLVALGCDAAQIAVADSVTGARALLEAKRYSLALIDIGLPDGSGVELIGWMQVHRPDTPAVVISAWRTEEIILSALQAGAIGYLLKERDDLELRLALRSIAQGGAPIDPAIARRILAWVTSVPAPAPVPADAPASTLTPRERKILELVAQGLSNRDMAASMRDDERGFVVDAANQGDGTGLRSLRDRARRLKAELRLSSRPDETQVAIHVPLGPVA